MTSNLALDAKGHIYPTETLDLSQNCTSLAYNILNRDMIYFQIVWTGLDAVDGIVTVESSNNLINWDKYTGSDLGLATAAGSHSFDVISTGPHYVRIKYAKGSNTAGTMTVIPTSKTRQK
jgi:hypothetical protein